jgi:hypothetical protein
MFGCTSNHSSIGENNATNSIANDDLYLYLDGSYESLIDNGLRCMGLNSLPKWNEKFTRVWVYDDYIKNNNYIFRLKLFQFGSRGKDNFATFHTLEWISENSKLRVIKNQQSIVEPKGGWVIFNSDLKRLKIDSLNLLSPTLHSPLSNGFNLTYLQYLHPEISITIDFSDMVGNNLEIFSEKELAFLKILNRIHSYFGIILSEELDFMNVLD